MEPTGTSTIPFQGYEAPIADLRAQMAGPRTAAPTQGGGMDLMGLVQQMMLQQSAPVKDEKPIPQWLWAIPGAAKGIAMRKQMDSQDEELKLRKQTLAGQQAQQKLAQLQTMQKIQNQQAMKRWGGLYGSLIEHDDVLDDTARRELRGEMIREMAESGDPEKIDKFLETEQNRDVLRSLPDFNKQLDTPSPEDAGAPDGALSPQAQTPQSQAGLPASYTALPPQLRQRIDQAVSTASTKYGVDPSEIYGLIQAESNFDPNAVSPKGAMGLMQLMPGTAADLKVDPRNIEQNIDGGARYYAQMKAKYKDPRLALAAYNAGPGRVDAAGGQVPNIAETQGHGTRALQAMGRFLSPGSAEAQTPGVAPDAKALEALAKDKVTLARLRQDAQHLEQSLSQTIAISGTKAGKAAREARADTLKTIRSDIERLDKKTAFTGSDIEQRIGVPVNYATAAQLQAARQEKQAEDIQKSERQGIQAAERQAQATEQAGERAYQAAVKKPLESGPAREKINFYMQAEDVAKALATEFTPAERAKYVGAFGLKLKGKQFAQAINELAGETTDPKLGRFAALLAVTQSEAFVRAGSALTDTERAIVLGYLPSGEEWSAADFEQKLAFTMERLPTFIEREMVLATTPVADLIAMRKAGKFPSFVAPKAGDSADVKTKPVSELTLDEARQEAERLMKGP